jgi:gas vesicle protein
MKTFLAGLGVGILLGVVLAPMSGEEFRNSVGDKANNLAGAVKDKYNQARKTASSAVNSVRERVAPRTGTEG